MQAIGIAPLGILLWVGSAQAQPEVLCRPRR